MKPALTPRDGADELFSLVRDEARLAEVEPESVDDALAVWITEALDVPVDPDDEAELLWLLSAELERLRDAVSALRAAVTRRLTNNVSKAGSIRLGETAFYVGRSFDRKIVDIEALVGFVDHVGGDLADVFRLNERNLRVTALRALFGREADRLELAGDDRKRYLATIEETFLESVPAGDVGELELKSIPVAERVWAQKLDHRQRKP